MSRYPSLLLATVGLLALPACGDRARLPVEAGIGAAPQLPPPTPTLIPTIAFAPAKGWPAGGKPMAASGLSVSAFATGLDHPRSLAVLPNGDVLVAETDAPPKPKDSAGIKGFFMKLLMKRAGSGRRPSANRITLLRDADRDGVAEVRETFLSGLNSPFGIVLVGSTLYVADTDALLRFPYRAGQTRIDAAPIRLTDLPAGTRNHHWTKSLAASADGQHLFVGVGSNSNVAEHGMAEEAERAAVWEIDPATGRHRILASGTRNPAALATEPRTGRLWAAVNERDELGSDLVPDYMTALVDGGFYGWPYSYYGSIVDKRVTPPRPELVATALIPDYALGAHTASLGLAFGTLPGVGDGVFVGQHGSWNRRPRSGYRVIFVPFAGGRPAGKPVEVLTGFLDAKGNALGRPVGVAIDASGALLVADDVGDTVWRVGVAATTTPR